MERKKFETFEDLLVWQKGIEFVKQVYLVTAGGKLNRDFGLRDQFATSCGLYSDKHRGGFRAR